MAVSLVQEEVARTKKLKYVGTKLPRVDSKIKVTGVPIYIGDQLPKNCYFAKIVRSSKAHARILKIDVEEALQIPGVVAILTADDVPGKHFVNAIIPDKPFLAKKEVNYVGEEIAIVVATSKKVAEQAAKKVKIRYKELPFNMDIDIEQTRKTPVCSTILVRGDVEKGFNESDVVVEETFETGAQEHAYLEPQSVYVDATGEVVHVYAATQAIYYVQKNVSKILGLPLSKVKVFDVLIGGGFGGKEEDPSWIAALAALASYKVKKPVTLIYDREEDILSTSKRHPSKVKVKIGADKEGNFKAVQAEIFLDGGAYGTISPAVLFLSVQMAPGPYRWPNVDIKGYVGRTNKPPSGAFRGFGAPQSEFAIESAIDMLAEKLGMNPIDLRIKNALCPGTETAAGHLLGEDTGFKETLIKAREISEFDKKLQEVKEKAKGNIRRGIAVASGWLSMGLGAAGFAEDRGVVLAQLTIDGKLIINFGATEMGQGIMTIAKQIAAEEFGAEIDDVKIIFSNSLLLPDTGPTVASRNTFVIGNAIRFAVSKLRDKILNVASEFLHKPVPELDIVGSYVVSKKEPQVRTSIAEIAAEGYKNHEAFIELGWYIPPKPFNDEKGVGEPFYGYSFATHVAEVEVDIETGRTHVRKVWAVHDSGKIINPITASGQVEGGIVQGLGLTLFEEFKYDDKGRIINNSLTDYLIPTIADAPDIQVEFVEKEYYEGPYGAKGIGEIPLVTIIPAVANAISNAIGKRITKIPATFESIYKKIKEG